MSWTRIGITLTTAVALLSIPLAICIVWLMLTSPVTVAGALDQRTITPLAREIAEVLVDALRGLMTYL